MCRGLRASVPTIMRVLPYIREGSEPRGVYLVGCWASQGAIQDCIFMTRESLPLTALIILIARYTKTQFSAVRPWILESVQTNGGSL